MCSGLHFHILPIRMIIKIVTFTVMWINAFSTERGVSNTYIPRNIIVGNQLDYAKHYRLTFEAYAQGAR